VAGGSEPAAVPEDSEPTAVPEDSEPAAAAEKSDVAGESTVTGEVAADVGENALAEEGGPAQDA